MDKRGWSPIKRFFMLILVLILLAPGSFTLYMYLTHRRDIEGNVESRLKVAVNTKSIKMAHEELGEVQKYLEREKLTKHGDAATFYRRIKWHHAKIWDVIERKDCRECCEELALLKLRLEFTDQGKEGGKPHVPNGLTVHPYYTYYCIGWWMGVPLFLAGLILLGFVIWKE